MANMTKPIITVMTTLRTELRIWLKLLGDSRQETPTQTVELPGHPGGRTPFQDILKPSLKWKSHLEIRRKEFASEPVRDLTLIQQ